MKFATLADLYAAILKGEINVDQTGILVDGGDFMVLTGGEEIFSCSYDQAMEFVSDILGLSYEHP